MLGSSTRVSASLAATIGIETPADVAAYLLAGADVVMTTSALRLAVPAGADPEQQQRSGYVRAMREANDRLYGWA